jgi:hypothetical protein
MTKELQKLFDSKVVTFESPDKNLKGSVTVEGWHITSAVTFDLTSLLLFTITLKTTLFLSHNLSPCTLYEPPPFFVSYRIWILHSQNGTKVQRFILRLYNPSLGV